MADEPSVAAPATAQVEPVAAKGWADTASLPMARASEARSVVDTQTLAMLAVLLWFVVASQLVGSRQAALMRTQQ